MSDNEYQAIMWAERKTDCYDGETCDQLRPYWNAYADGDKQDDDVTGCIELDPKHFPPGTKITVSVPVCPECHLQVELCEGSDCEFDWKEWEINEYS
jgi:hypothetical protein